METDIFYLPLKIWIIIFNILLITSGLLYYFYIRNLKKNKFIYIWLLILFVINIFCIRYTFVNYLNQSQEIGVQGQAGFIGQKGVSGKNKECGCSPSDTGNNKENRKSIIDIKNKVKDWIDTILSYTNGVNFLGDYFYTDNKWSELLEKPNETKNPFDLIKNDQYWNTN
jgi:hypothetical protein